MELAEAESIEDYLSITAEDVARATTGLILVELIGLSHVSQGEIPMVEHMAPLLMAEIDRRIGIPTNAPGVVASQTFIGSCTRCSAPMQIVASSVPSPGAWVCSKHVGEGTGGSQS